MARPDALEAHAPVPTKWLPGSVPRHSPTKEGTPKLPNKPRNPHYRQAGLALGGVVLVVAGATAGIVITNEITRSNDTNPGTQPRINTVPAELMRYPWDSRNQPIKLSIDSSSGKPIKEWTSTPQVLTAESGDGDISYYVSFLGDGYDNPINPDDPFGHVKITVLNEVMQGGVWLEETDVNGNSLVDSNGLVTLWKPYQVENLQIPEQAPAPVTG